MKEKYIRLLLLYRALLPRMTGADREWFALVIEQLERALGQR